MEVTYKLRRPVGEGLREIIPVSLRFHAAMELPLAARNFIFNSYLKSWQCEERNSRLHKAVYYSIQMPIIERIMKYGSVILAANPEDPTIYFGYLLYEQKLLQDAETGEDIVRPCIHYIYVKHIYRKCGIGSQLFSAYKHNEKLSGDILCSHSNWNFEKYEDRLKLICNPLLEK